MIPVTYISIEIIRHRETGEYVDFYLLLAGRLAKSYNRIRYDPANNTFGIYHQCDVTEQDDLDEDALARKAMIATAMEKGRFLYCEVQ